MRKMLLIIIIAISTVTLSADLSGSIKIGTSWNFEELSNPTFYTELWLNANFSDLETSGSFSLKDSWIDSFEVSFLSKFYSISLYKNRIFFNTDDYLGLYHTDSGNDGFAIKSEHLSGYIVSSLGFVYLKATVNPWFKSYFGVRKDRRDIALQLSYNENFNIFAEGAYTITSEASSGIYYLIGINGNNWGGKYYGGSNEYLPEYTLIDNTYTNRMNLWFNWSDMSFWSNLDLSALYSNTEIGTRYSKGDFWVELSKKGFENISYNPREIGEFHMAFGTNYSIFGFSGKVSYSFGKPAHNTVRTIGEVYYGEVSRAFRNFQFFAKLQYIIGLYERRFDIYSEVKFPSTGNYEVKLKLGNDDFYHYNTFAPILTFEVNSWW